MGRLGVSQNAGVLVVLVMNMLLFIINASIFGELHPAYRPCRQK